MLLLKNVTVDIAGTKVLRGISMAMQSAKIYAVVGRNGAGKTTLLRTIMGFTRVDRGELTLGEDDLSSVPPYKRAALGIGYAPEERVLFPRLSVLENLRLPCDSIGLSRQETDRRIEEIIEILPQVKVLLPRSGAALSGGQGKMAALARSLMVGQRLLLVDEPFQGLAPALAQQFAEALSKVCSVRPALCLVITESNASFLENVNCITLQLERGELTANKGATSTVP